MGVMTEEVHVNEFLPALHGMQTRSSDEKAVCPSVRLSNAWTVQNKKVLDGYLYHTKA